MSPSTPAGSSVEADGSGSRHRGFGDALLDEEAAAEIEVAEVQRYNAAQLDAADEDEAQEMAEAMGSQAAKALRHVPGEVRGGADEAEAGMMAFNLDEERDGGYYDEEGNYHTKQGDDSDDESDAWADQEEDGEKAGQPASSEQIAAQQRAAASEQAAAARAEAAAAREMSAADAAAVLQAAVGQHETVAAALRRLDASSDPAAKATFQAITHAADALVFIPMSGVFSTPLHALAEQHPGIFAAPAPAPAPAGAAPAHGSHDILWEICWEPGAAVHGPVTSSAMYSWMTAGYFNRPGVTVRRVANPDAAQDSDDDMFGDSDEEQEKPAMLDPSAGSDEWLDPANVPWRQLAAAE